jgi:hypothetical protein
LVVTRNNENWDELSKDVRDAKTHKAYLAVKKSLKELSRNSDLNVMFAISLRARNETADAAPREGASIIMSRNAFNTCVECIGEALAAITYPSGPGSWGEAVLSASIFVPRWMCVMRSTADEIKHLCAEHPPKDGLKRGRDFIETMDTGLIESKSQRMKLHSRNNPLKDHKGLIKDKTTN